MHTAQAADELDYTISQNSLQSKIALLVLHFPKLRIIWSRSLHATADIFDSLKNQQVTAPRVLVSTGRVLAPIAASRGGATRSLEPVDKKQGWGIGAVDR